MKHWTEIKDVRYQDRLTCKTLTKITGSKMYEKISRENISFFCTAILKCLKTFLCGNFMYKIKKLLWPVFKIK